MLEFIKSELAQFNIELVSSLSLDECDITRPYLLEKKEINSGSVIIFAVPYFTNNQDEKSNISAYAISRDYHFFFVSLFEKVIKNLEEKLYQYACNLHLNRPLDLADAMTTLGVMANKLYSPKK